MENVGLVTYREQLLLLDEARAPVWDRLWSQVVIAHELAHMWYGNFVTMPWWDDLWLNEAFATWMSWKVIADVDPALEVPLEVLGQTHGVMNLDSKRDARAIRQPIRHGGDIHNAFDGITYAKGAAVLHMLEAWIGETAFRDGVRTYMQDHAYGSGATADLLAALGQASGKPVAETIRLFLDQPGTPLVDVTLSCDRADSPAVRSILVRSLASFEDPGLLRRSLGAVLDRTLRTQDYRTLAGSIRRVVRPTAWQWLTEHYDQLVKKLGTKTALGLPYMASSFCSQEQQTEVKAFFEGRAGVPEGMARNVNLALEDIERCVRQRAAIREPLRKYLKESFPVASPRLPEAKASGSA